jgi:hypothetical protein
MNEHLPAQSALLTRLINEQQHNRRGQQRIALGLSLVLMGLFLPELLLLESWVRIALLTTGLVLLITGH